MTFKSLLANTYVRYTLFWMCVFLFQLFSSSLAAEMGVRQSSEIYATTVFCQLLAALICLKVLVPHLLDTGKTVLFVGSLLVLSVLLFAIYIAIRMNYLEVAYADYYQRVMPDYIRLEFYDRLFEPRVLLSKGIKFLTPTALILLARYYTEQQKLLSFKEQKKAAELSALKSQLNPHFLFNTLNNLYTLSLQKSDKAPEAISKLSEILDYMLYGCNEKFVALEKEIDLLDNYIALEKIRYGSRVRIKFEKSLNANVKIAPLMLLTFVENAFKHGVSQEMKEAQIDISVDSEVNAILFSVRNTIPNSTVSDPRPDRSIGLDNVRKQLNLLYPSNHDLEIIHENHYYLIRLKMHTA